MSKFNIFRKKAKVLPPVLCLYTAEMEEIFCDRIDAFPFPEETILAGSIKFFNDKAPCEIHRRAVTVRYCSEIESALPPDETVPAGQLPDEINEMWHEMNPAYIQLKKT